MKRRSQKKLGIILQYSQMGLSILISFIYTPVMLDILGKSEYGIYNLANSIISYLSLLSLGFGASYIRFYSQYKNNKDEKGIQKLNGLFLITFIVMGGIALISGILLSENVSVFFNDTYTTRDKQIARVLMILMTFNLAMTFPSSLFISYLTAHEEFVFQKLLSIVRTVVGPFFTLPVLLLGWGSIGMVIITTIVSIAADIINVTFCLAKLKMRFQFKKLNLKLLCEIAGFSFFIAVNQIIDQVNWQTDKVILGKLCSSTTVAVYAVGAQINTYFLQFSVAISSVFTPQIHQIENSEQDEVKKNKDHLALMIKVGRIQFMILALILSGFIFFGKFFVTKWAGIDYENAYYVALLLICPAMIALIQNIGIEIQRAKNRHQFRSIIYLIMAIINVFLSIWFTTLWEAVGAALGTTISLILANGLMMNIFYHKALHLDMLQFWYSILKIIPALLCPIGVGLIMNLYFTLETIGGFLVEVFVYSIVYFFSIYYVGMNKEEKSLVVRPIKNFMKKDDILG